MWPAESWLTRWDGAHPFPFVVCAEGWEVLCFSELPWHRPLVQQRCRMNEQETHLHSPAATRRELWKNQDFFPVLYIILAEAPPNWRPPLLGRGSVLVPQPANSCLWWENHRGYGVMVLVSLGRAQPCQLLWQAETASRGPAWAVVSPALRTASCCITDK